jgi:plasmid stabilization system protein ParE
VVPWDQPASRLVVPSWVEQDDELSQVSFTPKAQADLRQAISSGLMQPLYAENNSGFEAALETIKQLLAQDPRASHRRGTSTSMREPSYRIVFCRAQLEFKVSNDSVKVLSVRGADLADADYVDGIPLIGLQ